MSDTKREEIRLDRATFKDCPLCAAVWNDDAGCRGHREADALPLLPLTRLLLHNAGVAALYHSAALAAAAPMTEKEDRGASSVPSDAELLDRLAIEFDEWTPVARSELGRAGRLHLTVGENRWVRLAYDLLAYTKAQLQLRSAATPKEPTPATAQPSESEGRTVPCRFCGDKVRDNPISLAVRAHQPCIDIAARKLAAARPGDEGAEADRVLWDIRRPMPEKEVAAMLARHGVQLPPTFEQWDRGDTGDVEYPMLEIRVIVSAIPMRAPSSCGHGPEATCNECDPDGKAIPQTAERGPGWLE